MSAVWYRARAILRQRLAGTLVLIAVVALPAGVVLASVAGAARMREALPDFVAYNRAYDTLVFADPSPDLQQVLDQVRALPDWEVSEQVGAVVVSVRDGDHWVAVVPAAYVDGRPHVDQERPLVVEGRLPGPTRAAEVAVNEDFARDLGLHAGDTFALRTFTPAGLPAMTSGQASRDPDGEDLTMTVAGVIRRPADLRTSLSQQAEDLGSDSWYVGVGPAFVRRFGDRLANFGFGVAGRVTPGRQDDLADAISALGRDDLALRSTNESAELVSSIGRGIDFEANALRLFALIAAIAGAAFVGQAIGRQVFGDLDDDEASRSLGVDRRHRVAVPLVRSAIVAAGGAIGAVMLATALSPVFPIGLARQATLDPGVRVDRLTLGVGATALLVFVLGWAAIDAWRLTGDGRARADRPRSERPATSLSAVAARAGAPVSVTAGVRLALERGRGRTAVPVVGALLTTTAGVLVLCGVLVFASGLDHLVTTPVEQGWNWDSAVGNFNSTAEARAGAQALRANPDIASFNGYTASPVQIDGHEVYSLVLGPGDPALGPPVIDGRLPGSDDETAVGTQTLAALDKGIGDTLTAQVPGTPGGPREFRIVGTVVLPAGLDTELSLGRGAVVTLAGARATVGGGPEAVIPQEFLVRFAEGVTPAQAADSLRPAFGDGSPGPRPASDVTNLQRVQRMPRVLALLVGLLALGTLANVLVTSVRRRRRDLATYAAIGFRRRQLAATVAWQATTFALLALVAGVPLGLAAGRTVWTLVANSIGSTTDPVVPTALLALVVVGTLVAANLIAALPARAAARTRPAQILRSE